MPAGLEADSTADATADFTAVTCADAPMLPAACCALLSVRRNVAGPLRLVLVAVDPGDADARAVAGFAARHGIDIEMIPFESARLPPVGKGRWNRSAMTRLFIGDLLGEGGGRLLYLDADALAVAPLEHLRDVDLGGTCAAAVGDYLMAFPAKLAARRRDLGLGPEAPYFNSGVILFDWADPRARRSLEDALEAIRDFSGPFLAPDQDALNVALEGKWLALDPRWNTQTGFMRDIADPAIVHFTGRRKPWQTGARWQHRAFSRLYADWLAGTDWQVPRDPLAPARRAQSLLLHGGRRIEEWRKARRVSAYLRDLRDARLPVTAGPDDRPPLPGDGAGAAEWRAFLAPYSHIVLVANSDEVDIAALERDTPPDTLFIFFNKVYKVLDGVFRRPALLASRSGMLGANLVHRREVPAVLRHFDEARFLGILNIIIGNDERFSSAAEFGVARVAHLDLDPLVAPMYPAGMVPTTGFGLCLWLRSLDLPATITLAGFSSRRSERWKVFEIHDWTYEQVVLRLMAQASVIAMTGGGGRDAPYAALASHFPEFTPARISAVTDEVLSERLAHLSSVVDRLMSITKPLRLVDRSFRRLRPRTRKQKHLDRQKEPGGR